jgi:16S rRNA (guanine527-N7)-methyltransferase
MGMFHVKQPLLLSDLIQFLNKQNIHLDGIQIQQLELYYSELRISADKINLISSNDKEYIIERHFLPSFYFLYYMQIENNLLNKHILDLGTGAGFPGIILAIVLSSAKITLIDSSRKKTLFLKKLISKLNLKVDIICERIENLPNSSFNSFDIIVARAVASIPILFNWCIPFLKKNGYMLTLKGDNYKKELNNNLNINLNELQPYYSWYNFSDYLINKRMVKISNT